MLAATFRIDGMEKGTRCSTGLAAKPLEVCSLCATQIEGPQYGPQQPLAQTQRIHILSATQSLSIFWLRSALPA